MFISAKQSRNSIKRRLKNGFGKEENVLATKKHNSRHQKEFLKMGEEGLGEVDEQRYMTLNSLKYKGRARLKERELHRVRGWGSKRHDWSIRKNWNATQKVLQQLLNNLSSSCKIYAFVSEAITKKRSCHGSPFFPETQLSQKKLFQSWWLHVKQALSLEQRCGASSLSPFTVSHL